MKRRSLIRFLLSVLLLACLAAAATLVLELVAGHLFPPPDHFYIWPPGLQRTFSPRQDILPGTSPRARFSVNSYGLRGGEPSPDDDYRLIVLGGSAAECLYLDQERTWPALIMENLNRADPERRVWTANGGRSGQSSRDHALELEYLPLKLIDPDAVIVCLGVNDLILRLRQDQAYDPHALDRPGGRDLQIDRAFLFVPDEYSLPPPPWYKRTGIWRALREAKQILSAENPQDAKGAIVETWRGRRKKASEWRAELPEMGPALREYVVNLRRLIALAAEKDLRLVFVTQPSVWREGMTVSESARLWMGGVGNFQIADGLPYYTPGALGRGLKLYHDVLKSVCEWSGTECFDLAARLSPSTENFYDDCHFTEKGSREAARLIGEYLLSRPPWKTGEE
jgi:hypothetical protein